VISLSVGGVSLHWKPKTYLDASDAPSLSIGYPF
jgi:hypothetical protein